MSRYSLRSSSPFLQAVIRSFQSVGMSTSTQQAYIRWVREFIAYFGIKRHPKDISEEEIAQFITYIAVDLKLGHSSQNQAMCALVHVYKYVVRRPIGDLDNLLWSKKPKKLPVVYSKKDIAAFLPYLYGDYKLMVKIALCSGLRISECCGLVIGSLDFERGVIRVFSGKGNKDRETYLPAILEDELLQAVILAKAKFEQDLIYQEMWSATEKPFLMAKDAMHQAIFTSDCYRWNADKGAYGRFPLSRQYVRKQFNLSLQKSGLGGKGSFHTLRHTFASHSYHHGINIRELQALLGHSSVETTQIYTHILGGRKAVVSPLDEWTLE